MFNITFTKYPFWVVCSIRSKNSSDFFSFLMLMFCFYSSFSCSNLASTSVARRLEWASRIWPFAPKISAGTAGAADRTVESSDGLGAGGGGTGLLVRVALIFCSNEAYASAAAALSCSHSSNCLRCLRRLMPLALACLVSSARRLFCS